MNVYAVFPRGPHQHPDAAAEIHVAETPEEAAQHVLRQRFVASCDVLLLDSDVVLTHVERSEPVIGAGGSQLIRRRN